MVAGRGLPTLDGVYAAGDNSGGQEAAQQATEAHTRERTPTYARTHTQARTPTGLTP